MSTQKERSNSLIVPQQSLGGRKSSLFSRDSFHEGMLKKKEGNRSVVSLAQQPDDHTPTTKPKFLYENTYQLEPKRKFPSAAAQAIINQNLEQYLKDESYDPQASAQMSKTLAQIIKDGVKELVYERYKIVCLVTIGQMSQVGLQQASRCVWDIKWDTYASGSYKNKTLFGVATVYAVYQE